MKLFRLSVVTGEAARQDGGGLARACKAYPGISMPSDDVRARGDSGGCRWLFYYNFGFVVVDNDFPGKWWDFSGLNCRS